MAVVLIGASILCALLYKDVKRIVRKVNKRIQSHDIALELDNLTEEKTCIICYAKTRNLIIFGCRHLIMCEDCFHDDPVAQCPICKENVTETKVIHSTKK